MQLGSGRSNAQWIDELTRPDPEQRTLQRVVLRVLAEGIAQELTERQRQAWEAAYVQSMPLAEVARRVGSNRNAVYKLLHDARQRLRERLLERGLSPDEVLAAFSPQIVAHGPR